MKLEDYTKDELRDLLKLLDETLQQFGFTAKDLIGRDVKSPAWKNLRNFYRCIFHYCEGDSPDGFFLDTFKQQQLFFMEQSLPFLSYMLMNLEEVPLHLNTFIGKDPRTIIMKWRLSLAK